MSSNSGFGYIKKESPIHSLTGTTKLLMTIILSIAVMITYDTRFLTGVIAGSAILFMISKIQFRDIRLVIALIAVIMLINCIAIYLFSPEEGVKIYGTRHEFFHIAGRYSVTKEQLFYMLNVVLKYFSVLPLALVFITTTEPSEFASSLNSIGVSYKIAYSVALALRYIPDVRRDYHEIAQAQQARGIDMSKKVRLIRRIKNASAILLPLVFTSLSRIDLITNAMELRSFGKHKKRTWYRIRKFQKIDLAVIVISVLLLLLSLSLNYINKGRFYNPFI